jgi:peptidoglycan hydrolase-like protein with peptidoglycan-binding domain
MSRKVTVHAVGDEDKEPYPPPMPPAQPELPLEGLRRGDVKIAVSVLQTRIGAPNTGVYDDLTEYTVRRLQEQFALNVDGVATPRVHSLLGLPWPPLDS